MNPNYNQTITIYNRIPARDTASKRDEWNKTVLRGCSWRCTTADTQMKDQQSMMNRNTEETYTVRIPQKNPQNPDFRKYAEWKDNPEGSFTISKSDVIILGECSEEISGVSPNTAAEILQRYKPDAFLVKSFADNTSHLVGKHYKVGG